MISYLIKILILTLAFQWIGGFILAIMNRKISKSFYHYFLTQLTGVTVTTTLTALWFTRGGTVLAGFVIIASGFFLQKPRINITKKSGLQIISQNLTMDKSFIWLLLPMIILFAIQYFILHSTKLKTSTKRLRSSDSFPIGLTPTSFLRKTILPQRLLHSVPFYLQ